ncbi:hypothetical protein LCGC14_2683020 [marine sediment metagenome]|uniref:Uncharacterized protein n=1 Tax=marine sediment metagenome TaxID=412755 RepID=A0A0F9CCI1_9ZZZZ
MKYKEFADAAADEIAEEVKAQALEKIKTLMLEYKLAQNVLLKLSDELERLREQDIEL